MPPRSGNQSGHWEPLPIVELNDELLTAASMTGMTWAVPVEWLDGPSVRNFAGAAIDLAASEFGDSALFVLKDPRICRMVPFWRSVLEEIGAMTRFVLPLRNPLEVAASLKRRDGLPTRRVAPLAAATSWTPSRTPGTPRASCPMTPCSGIGRPSAASISERSE